MFVKIFERTDLYTQLSFHEQESENPDSIRYLIPFFFWPRDLLNLPARSVLMSRPQFNCQLLHFFNRKLLYYYYYMSSQASIRNGLWADIVRKSVINYVVILPFSNQVGFASTNWTYQTTDSFSPFIGIKCYSVDSYSCSICYKSILCMPDFPERIFFFRLFKLAKLFLPFY